MSGADIGAEVPNDDVALAASAASMIPPIPQPPTLNQVAEKWINMESDDDAE